MTCSLFKLFLKENKAWHFIKIVPRGDSLNEMSNLYLLWKIRKNTFNLLSADLANKVKINQESKKKIHWHNLILRTWKIIFLSKKEKYLFILTKWKVRLLENNDFTVSPL